MSQFKLLSAVSGIDRRRKHSEKFERAVKKEGSPTAVYTGDMIQWHKTTFGDDEYRRSNVMCHKPTEVATEFDSRYNKKAFMSMDGLLRPVSMAGDGGFPQYPTISNLGNTTTPPGSQPPVKDSGATLTYNLEVDLDYLHPFVNPDGGGFSFADKHGTSEAGHDIDIVGRGASVPGSGLSIQIDINGGNPGYASDYRMMALKGPLLMQGWG